MDDETRAAIGDLAGQVLANRLLLIVLMAHVMRRSGDPVGAAAWLGEAAAEAATAIDPAVIPHIRQAVRWAMEVAEGRPGQP